MMKGDHGQTNQLHDINWGARDHASHAPQLITLEPGSPSPCANLNV